MMIEKYLEALLWVTVGKLRDERGISESAEKLAWVLITIGIVAAAGAIARAYILGQAGKLG